MANQEPTAEEELEGLPAVAASLALLATSLTAMATKEEVRESEDRQRRRMGWLAILGAVCIVLLAIPATVSVVSLGTLRANAVDGAIARDRIVECSTPSPGPGNGVNRSDDVHECYEESERRTTEAIGSLSLNTLDAVICAATNPTETTILECFQKRMQARTQPGSSSP